MRSGNKTLYQKRKKKSSIVDPENHSTVILNTRFVFYC